MAQLEQLIAYISFFAYWLLIASVAIRVVVKRRAVGVSLAWMLVIFIVPLVGVVFYLLFGELTLGKRRAERAREMYDPYAQWLAGLTQCNAHQPQNISEYAQPIHQLCQRRLGIPSLSGNQLELYNETDTILRAMIRDIDEARESIEMEFYIWNQGGLADDVAIALMRASERGVRVRILLDSAGSMRFFRSHWPRMFRQHKIDLVEALKVNPFRMFLRRLDLRLHRKIVVIDNQIAYTGSMNLVDPKFFKSDAGVGEWVDVMVRVTGPAVAVLANIYAWDWEVETGERVMPPVPVCPLDEALDGHHAIQVVPSGPGMPDEVIHQVLLLSIYQARESLVITTPYFVPSENLLSALIGAAARGVRVEIIIPDRNDSLMVEMASRSFLQELMAAGVHIYRFRGGLLHTKSVVVDQAHCLVGTVNLDMRSLWLNFEVTLSVDDPEFTQIMYQQQQAYVSQSVTIDQKAWTSRPLYEKAAERFFYLFSPLL